MCHFGRAHLRKTFNSGWYEQPITARLWRATIKHWEYSKRQATVGKGGEAISSFSGKILNPYACKNYRRFRKQGRWSRRQRIRAAAAAVGSKGTLTRKQRRMCGKLACEINQTCPPCVKRNRIASFWRGKARKSGVRSASAAFPLRISARHRLPQCAAWPGEFDWFPLAAPSHSNE